MYKPTPDCLISETGSAISALCAAILTQAVVDYQDLCNKGARVINTRQTGRYTKNEIIKFFRSKWGGTLLEEIGGHFSGEQIIKMLEKFENEQPLKEHESIAAYTLDGKLVATFRTLLECAEFAKLKTTSGICRCCQGRKKTAGGYVWKYI